MLDIPGHVSSHNGSARGYKAIFTALTSAHAPLLVIVLGAVLTEFDDPWNVLTYAAGVGSG